MANEEHKEIILSGVSEWNEWKDTCDEYEFDLSNLDLSGRDLSDVDFEGVRLERTDLSFSDLSGAMLQGCDLRHATLRGADLSRTLLRESRLFRADLSDANLNEANLCSADLQEARLRGCNLVGSIAEDANFGRADLSELLLTGPEEEERSFAQALRIYKKLWTSRHLLVRLLSSNDIEYLAETPGFEDIIFGNFKLTSLDHARLGGADLCGANLRFANLSDADLSKADLSGADLKFSRLTGADLRATNFNGATLTGGSLLGISVNARTRFSNGDRNAGDVANCAIDRYALEQLDQYGGLDIVARDTMKIRNDLAELRATYSGLRAWLHMIGLIIFLAPYLWFVGFHYTEARFQSDPTGNTITVGEALARYIWNGGVEWQNGFNSTWTWSFAAFVLLASYHSARAWLTLKTKKIEHRELVTGQPVRFSLSTKPRLRVLFYTMKYVAHWAAWIIVAANTYHFLGQEIDISNVSGSAVTSGFLDTIFL